MAVDLLKELFPREDELIDAVKVAKDLLSTSPMNEGLRQALHVVRDFLLRSKV